jgi:hypothetical protein
MLSADDSDRNYYCVAEVIRNRRLRGQPIPRWLVEHYRRLEAQIHAAMAQPGHEIGENSDRTTPLGQQHDWITAVEAAAILKLSKRQVTRIAPDLDGRKAGQGWLFPRESVIRYANERRRAA